MSPSFATWIATFGRVGFARKAPGTWGTLAALPFGVIALATIGVWGLAAISLIALIIGTSAADIYEAHIARHDPKEIVIDEAVGIWLTLAISQWFATMYSPAEMLTPMIQMLGIGLSFVWFRVFDIFKPWPIGWVDARVHGGLGTMLDDVLAGVAAAIAVCITAHFVLIP
jgi:phosphatidylglycerophosphatase A